MDEFTLNDLLECSVCLERLDTSSKVLPCQHTFCRKCLEEIVLTYHELRCPECRVLVDVGVHELPPNVLLMRILEGIRNPPKRPRNIQENDQNCPPEVNKSDLKLESELSDAKARNRAARLATLRKTDEAHAIAKYDFVAREPGDLGFHKGDVIILRKKIDSCWYQGECRGIVGVFPLSYVQVVVPLPGHGPECVALYDFTRSHEDEECCLYFNEGDVITIIRRIDSNWAEGRLGDRVGIFPINFVDMNEVAKVFMRLSYEVTPLTGLNHQTISGDMIRFPPGCLPATTPPRTVDPSGSWLYPSDSSSSDVSNTESPSTPSENVPQPFSNVNRRRNFDLKISRSAPCVPQTNNQGTQATEENKLRNRKGKVTKENGQGESSDKLQFQLQQKVLQQHEMQQQQLRQQLKENEEILQTTEQKVGMNPREDNVIPPRTRSRSPSFPRTKMRSHSSSPRPQSYGQPSSTSHLLPTIESPNETSNVRTPPLRKESNGDDTGSNPPPNAGASSDGKNPSDELDMEEALRVFIRQRTQTVVTDVNTNTHSSAKPSNLWYHDTPKILPELVTAIHPYKPQKCDELELKRGWTYTVTERCQDGWYKGTSLSTDKSGVYPGNYVVSLHSVQEGGNAESVTNGTATIEQPKPSQDPHKQYPNEYELHPVTTALYVKKMEQISGPSTSRVYRPPPPELPQRSHSPLHSSQKPRTGRDRLKGIVPEESSMASMLDTTSSFFGTAYDTFAMTRQDKPKEKKEKSSFMRRLTSMRKSKSPPLPAYSLDNPVFEHTSTPLVVSHARSDSCPSQLTYHDASNTSRVVAGGSQRIKQRHRPSLHDNSSRGSSKASNGKGGVKQEAINWQEVRHSSHHRKSNSLDADSYSHEERTANAKPILLPLPTNRYRCIVPYPPHSEFELELKMGDIIYVHRKRDDGWYKGTLQRNGRTGLFPSSFVESI